MDEDELSALTVAELKVRLKELGLTTSGKKADLIARLIESEDEGDVLIPGHIFLFVAGIIGWSGREYVRAVRGQKNAAESEIIIDTSLAWQCLKRGAAWPLHANREGKNGGLREPDNNVSLNGPR